MGCLGINFLPYCSDLQLEGHFLFNFQTAISALAIVVSIYALILERRFKIRSKLREHIIKKLKFLIGGVFLFTFIGAVLPYFAGEPIVVLGYSVFWEVLGVLLLAYSVILSFVLFKPISTLKDKHIKKLHYIAPYGTLNFHGIIDLMLVESEYFWSDMLNKSIDNELLKEVIENDFSQKDFLWEASRSEKIVHSTIQFINNNKSSKSIKHVVDFFRKLLMESIVRSDSVLAIDLDSDKNLSILIFQKYKLAKIIFDKDFYYEYIYPLERKDSPEYLDIIYRIVTIFHICLNNKYYHNQENNVLETEKLISVESLNNFLLVFDNCIRYLNVGKALDFLNNITSSSLELKNLPEDYSDSLVRGFYKIIESYAIKSENSNNYNVERLVFRDLYETYVSFNDYSRIVFENKLLEKIAGIRDGKVFEGRACNLEGYYPNLIPFYFYIYGYDLFSGKESSESKNVNFHLKILKRMSECLPKIANGRTQEYFGGIEMPKDKRGFNIVKNKAENFLNNLFPANIIYNIEENSITYVFGNEEMTKTIMLNDVLKNNKIFFKKI